VDSHANHAPRRGASYFARPTYARPMRHLPNVLTILRVVVTPLVFWAAWKGYLAREDIGSFDLSKFWWTNIAFTTFVAAAISDWWDGYLARKHSVSSRLGAFLDPLADKVLVIGTFVVLAWLYPSLVPWWAVALIALRDVGVTLLRSWAEATGRHIQTSTAAKWKTAFQLTFLIAALVFLWARTWTGPLADLADAALFDTPVPLVLLVAVVAVTLWTGWLYVPRSPSVPHA
jgi:CDP-diacylglycerol--glycerol-3-phosphate 3-phosphatidyltransferase